MSFVVTSSAGFSCSSAGAARGSTRVGWSGGPEDRVVGRGDRTSCGGRLGQRGQVLSWESLRVDSLSLSLCSGAFNGPHEVCNPIGRNRRAIENCKFSVGKEISKVERTVVAYDHAAESNWVSILVPEVEKRGVIAGSRKAIRPLALELLRRRVIGVVRNVEEDLVWIIRGRRREGRGGLFCCVCDCFVKEGADFVRLVATGSEVSIKMVGSNASVIWIGAERVEPVDHPHHQAGQNAGGMCRMRGDI